MLAEPSRVRIHLPAMPAPAQPDTDSHPAKERPKNFEESQMLRTSRFRVFALLILLGALIAPNSHAQTAVDGAVGGTVVDASGAIVGGATVTVVNNGTNAEQTAQADSDGYFRIIHLQPGTYTVTITAAGFEPYKALDALVQVGLLTTIDPHMQVG